MTDILLAALKKWYDWRMTPELQLSFDDKVLASVKANEELEAACKRHFEPEEAHWFKVLKGLSEYHYGKPVGGSWRVASPDCRYLPEWAKGGSEVKVCVLESGWFRVTGKAWVGQEHHSLHKLDSRENSLPLTNDAINEILAIMVTDYEEKELARLKDEHERELKARIIPADKRFGAKLLATVIVLLATGLSHAAMIATIQVPAPNEDIAFGVAAVNGLHEVFQVGDATMSISYFAPPTSVAFMYKMITHPSDYMSHGPLLVEAQSGASIWSSYYDQLGYSHNDGVASITVHQDVFAVPWQGLSLTRQAGILAVVIYDSPQGVPEPIASVTMAVVVIWMLTVEARLWTRR